MAGELTGKTALVTGASGGIGLELARILARNGAGVVLVARREAELNNLAAELRTAHQVPVHVVPNDLAAPNAAGQIVQGLSHKSIDIDILINNAGFAIRGEFAKTDPAAQLELLQVNIVALTQLTHLLLAPMLHRRWGRILNVASISAYMPGPLMATYFASKAYVLSFSEALANETVGSGVSVTALCPGPTRTGFEQRGGLSSTKAFRSSVMDAAAVARVGYRAMMKGKRVVIAGFWNKLRMLPIPLVPRRMLAHFARKYHEAP